MRLYPMDDTGKELMNGSALTVIAFKIYPASEGDPPHQSWENILMTEKKILQFDYILNSDIQYTFWYRSYACITYSSAFLHAYSLCIIWQRTWKYYDQIFQTMLLKCLLTEKTCS